MPYDSKMKQKNKSMELKSSIGYFADSLFSIINIYNQIFFKRKSQKCARTVRFPSVGDGHLFLKGVPGPLHALICPKYQA